MKKLYPIFFFLLISQFSFSQDIIYVNAAASGADNGTTWTNAYTDLQNAIQEATYGDQIWVAEGLYKPALSTDREIYFELKNGVQWYGGFVGNETNLEDRDYLQNETILSGDIGVEGDSLDNSYTVVYTENTDENTVIEGFIVEKGNANNEDDISFDDATVSGGGMYMLGSAGDMRCQVLHNNFRDNNSKYFGGGLYVENRNSASVRPYVYACAFKRNNALSAGGGFYWCGGTNLVDEIVYDSLSFYQNTSSLGAAMTVIPTSTDALFVIKNSTFLENISTSISQTSILYIDEMAEIAGVELRNNYFELNQGRAFFRTGLVPFNYVGVFDNFMGYNTGGGIYIEGYGAISGNELIIENNNLEWNSASEGAGIHAEIEGGANINVRRNTLTYNGADFSGGGFLCNNSDAIVRLYSNYFKGNSAQEGVGGGARIDSDDMIVANCIFDANIGKTGAGLRINNGTVLNSVFYKNNALQQGGAIRCTSPTIANCIFKENVNFGIGPNIFNNSWPLTVSSCLFDAADCEGINYDNSNITCDANTVFDTGVQFTNPNLIDFSLSACSPAIDAGDNSFLSILEEEFDYYGNDRVQGESVDMGVAEFSGMTLTAAVGNEGDCAGEINNGILSYSLENACLPLIILLNDEEIISETLEGNIEGLAAADYDFTITDAVGRTLNQVVNIPFSPAPEIDIDISHPSCSNYTNGVILTSISGDLSPFSIVWEDESTGLNRYGLSGGLYQYSVTDDHGCLALGDVNIVAPDTIQFNETIQNLSCTGGDTGAIILNTTGGTGEYDFTWSPNIYEGEELTDIAAGSYIVTVTDENDCSLVGQFLVQNASEIETNADIQNVACENDSSGSISLLTTGGDGNYSYNWSPNPNNQEGNSLTNIPAGTYAVTINDGGDCEEILEYTIENAAPFGLNVETTPLNCANENTGIIVVSPIGGAGELTYSWSPNPNNETGSTLTNLAAGIYNLTITDANNCETEGEFIIESPSEIALSESIENTLCADSASGSISINANGGTGDFSYNWSPNPNNEEDNSLTNIPAGEYSLTVTDANGCEQTAVYTVENADAISLETSTQNTLCFGTATGSIIANPTGGTGDFTYNWFPNLSEETGATLSNIPAGTYFLTVTDENDCELTAEYEIAEALSIVLEAEIMNTECNGQATGAITVTTINGTPDFEFVWSNEMEGATITDLESGVYTVTATDANGCSIEEIFIVQDANAINVESVIMDNLCYQGSLGSISVDVNNGGGELEYIWSENANGQEGSEINDLVSGTYFLTIVDEMGCESLNQFEITEPTEIIFNTETQDVSCAGEETGLIFITTIGGTPFEDESYLYEWQPNPNGEQGNTLSDVSAGVYAFTIEDANGCQVTGEDTILEPNLLTATAAVTDASCYGFEDGSALITVAGGTTPYEYSDDLNNLGAGNYTISVMDAAGCDILVDFIIAQPDELNFEFDIILASTSTSSDGAIYIDNIVGGTPMYDFEWENGETDQNLINIPAGNYNLNITDEANCTYNFGFNVEYLTNINSLSNYGVEVSLLPNLVLGDQNLRLEVESIEIESGSYKVIDNLGRILETEKIVLERGENEFILENKNWSRGVYFVQINMSDGGFGVFKFLVE